MRRLAGLVVLGALEGCANFESIEDACKDNVRGDRDASPEAVAFMQRIACHRRYAGINRGQLHPRVSEATEAHAAYLGTNGIFEDWPLEEPGTPGYTGFDAYVRLEATDYLSEGTTSNSFVWEVLAPSEPARTRADVVDAYMHDPFFRDVLLSPAWEAGGYAEFNSGGLDWFYMNIVLYYPSGARSNKPVIYPVEGQTGIPTTWNNWLVGDPLMNGVPAITGYPITFTCGSSEVSDGSNPLAVSVASSVITGPEGPVEHIVKLPGYYWGGPDNSTAILFPLAPLQPSTTYTVDVTMGWINVPKKEVSTTFTTGAGPATSLFRETPRVQQFRPPEPVVVDLGP